MEIITPDTKYHRQNPQ